MREPPPQETILVDGHPLRFIRCDKDGNEIPPEKLAEMNFTNETINRVVSQAAARFGGDREPDGSFFQGISSL